MLRQQDPVVRYRAHPGGLVPVGRHARIEDAGLHQLSDEGGQQFRRLSVPGQEVLARPAAAQLGSHRAVRQLDGGQQSAAAQRRADDGAEAGVDVGADDHFPSCEYCLPNRLKYRQFTYK